MLRKINIDINIFLDKKKIKLMNLRSEKITKISSEIAKLKFVRQNLYHCKENLLIIRLVELVLL